MPGSETRSPTSLERATRETDTTVTSDIQQKPRSFTEVARQDQQNVAALRNKGPDILTGYTFPSRTYQNRLNNLFRTSYWTRFTERKDTIEKIAEDASEEFDRICSEVAKEKYVSDHKRLDIYLNDHNHYFRKYKREMLTSKHNTRKYQAFDRMLMHLDILERHRRQIKEGVALSPLDDESLHKVYESLEENYQNLCQTIKSRTNFRSRDQKVKKYSENCCRAYLTIIDETFRNRELIYQMVSRPNVRQESSGQLEGNEATLSKAEVESSVVQALKDSGKTQDEAQNIAKAYVSAIETYGNSLESLQDMIGSYGKNINRVIHSDSRYIDIRSYAKDSRYGGRVVERSSRMEVLQASSDFVKNSKKVIALGRLIQKSMEQPSTSHAEGSKERGKKREIGQPEIKAEIMEAMQKIALKRGISLKRLGQLAQQELPEIFRIEGDSQSSGSGQATESAT